jgi:hypothetical protein
MLELLKDMKKTKEDAKSVTMTHPKGHSVVLVLSKLPGIQKEALKRLPLYEGGDIKGVHKSSMGVERPDTSKSWNEKRMAGSSKAGDAAKNTIPERLNPDREEREENKNLIGKAKDEHHRVLGEIKAQPKPKLQGLAKGGHVKGCQCAQCFDEGGKADSDSDDSDNSNSPDTKQAPVVVNVGQPPIQSPAAQQAATPAAASQPAPTPSNMQMTPPQGNAPQEQQMAKTYGAYGNELNAVQAQNAANRTAVDKAHEGWDAFNANPDNKFDADQYRKNMSLPAKVSTGIGLFLGGFSVPFGGQNFAQDFLNKQIQNNIDAQKENYGRQKNVWGAAKDLFGDNQVADNFAKTTALDQVNNQIAQTALSNKTPLVTARAQNLINTNKAQQEALKNNSAQILTNKQQASQNQSPSFLDKVKSALGATSNWLPTGGPSTEAGTSPPSQSGPKPGKNEAGITTEVPQTDPVPQFSIDESGLKNSQFLGAKGVPNQITPGEVGSANEESAKAKATNDKLNLIHQNFAKMWQNRSDSNAALQYLSGLGVNAGGFHLATPNMTAWTEGTKNYYRAASTIENELASLVGGGGLTHEQAETIRNKFIKTNDSPDDYRDVLKSIDNNVLSTVQTPVLDKYGKIKRPKITE